MRITADLSALSIHVMTIELFLKYIFMLFAKISVTSDTSVISATNATSATNEVKYILELVFKSVS
jgi:hypothetical protein